MSKYLVNKKNKNIFNGVIPRYELKKLFENNKSQELINLPTNWKIIYIVFRLSDGTKLTMNILNKNLEIENRFRTGYFLTSGSNGSVGVLISNNTIKFDEAYNIGKNVISNSIFSVYYS